MPETQKNPRIPFDGVPRRWLNLAAVAGGLAGLLVGQQAGWSDVQTFIATLFIAGGGVLLTGWVYARVAGSLSSRQHRGSR